MFPRRKSLRNLINTRFDELKEILMATQAEIDAVTAQLADFQTQITGNVSALAADVTAIQAELANVPAGVDISGLQAAAASLATNVGNLGTTVSSVTALVPAAPAPPAV